MLSVADSLVSECGPDFDEYVRRALDEPFPYSSMHPVSRSVDNLWKGRRLRIYSSPNEFRTGKVISWSEWNDGPLGRVVYWGMNIEMDSFDPGDDVKVEGLKAAKQCNGERGAIIRFLEEEGRFKVKLTNKNHTISIKPQNIKTATSYALNRMNIEGGGTLTLDGDPSEGRLISLEWLAGASFARH